jgi:hypothetical protein
LRPTGRPRRSQANLSPVSTRSSSSASTPIAPASGAAPKELDALRSFLRVPGNLLAVAPHHNIGDDPELEFRHHGDPTIPPEQRFGGFARSILDSLAPGRRSTRPRRRHPFTASGRATFDALLQSRPGVFTGDLIVVDATLWSSTAGGTESLQRFWANLFARQHR